MAKANPIATLAARATSESAAAPAQQALKTGAAITGQYLYDQFVQEGKADITKLDIVANAVRMVDTATFKAALAEMVKIAKESGNEAKHRTAANNQSALRALYGALKFAGEDAQARGLVVGRIGYHEARVIAQNVLKEKALTWEGYPTKTPEQREKERAAKLHQKALKEVQDAYPHQPGEDLGEYFDRIKAMTAARIEELTRTAETERIAKLAEKVLELCGDDFQAVLQHLIDTVRLEIVEPAEQAE